MKSSRVQLIVILFLFFVPLIGAFIWYYGLDALGQKKPLVNNGELLLPIQTLADFSEQNAAGQSFTLDDLNGKWTLVHFIKQRCTPTCDRVLYNTRQSKAALGRESERVQRIVLLDRNSRRPAVFDQHPQLIVLTTSANSGLSSQLNAVLQRINAEPDATLLIDPLGNIVMHFAADLEARLLLKDLQKLLKYSKIG